MRTYLTWSSIDTGKIVGFENVGELLIWFVEMFELQDIDEKIFIEPANVTCTAAY